MLDAHRDGLEELLGDTFDPDSKRSVIAIFEQVIEAAQEAQVEGIRRLVATDDEDGPLGRLRHEITRHTNECTRELRQEVQALSERIAVKDAVAPVIAITTGKGFTYRGRGARGRRPHRVAPRRLRRADRQDQRLGGDAEGRRGRHPRRRRHATASRAASCSRRRRASSTCARPSRSSTPRSENRDALAAIAVFSAPDEAPTSVPFQYTGNKAIVVFDADDGDDSALRLGYMWARWVVRRELAGRRRTTSTSSASAR